MNKKLNIKFIQSFIKTIQNKPLWTIDNLLTELKISDKELFYILTIVSDVYTSSGETFIDYEINEDTKVINFNFSENVVEFVSINDGELFNLHNGFKFGEYKSQNGCIWDLKEFAILADSYDAWLEKENLPKMDIGDLLYCFEPINGKHLTDTQRDTLRSYERMWTLVDDAFNKKEEN